MKTYEYTYTVKEVNLIGGNVLVEYKPTNINLTTITLNLPAHMKKEGEENFTDIAEIILSFAPHLQWEAQEYLKEQYDNIMNKTDTVVPNA